LTVSDSPKRLYGDSEEVIGKWFARTGKRKDIFLASKFGLWIDAKGIQGPESSPEFLKKACEQSLKNLQTDVIDLVGADSCKSRPKLDADESSTTLTGLNPAFLSNRRFAPWLS
jgi:aryl-alcohol dehydrogenase-like predicted oxidoreductase